MRPPICDKTAPPHLENPGSATGHTDIAQILVQYGSPVNQKDGKGRSAKQMALALGDEEMIEVLKGEGSQRMNEDRQ